MKTTWLISGVLVSVLAGSVFSPMTLAVTQRDAASHAATLAPALLTRPERIVQQPAPQAAVLQPAAEQQPLHIQGRVLGLNANTGQPSVQAVLPDGSVVAREPVDVDGSFEMGALPRGIYTLQVADLLTGGVLALDAAADVDVQPDASEQFYSLTLAEPKTNEARPQQTQSPGAIEANGFVIGRVTSSGGTPISNYTVEIFRTSSPDNRYDSETTDSNGVFTFTLSPNTYKIRVGRPGTGNFAAEWYPDSLSFAAASTLTVLSEQTISGIDATLEAGGVITGQVRRDTGAILSSGAYVYLRDKPSGDDYTALASTNVLYADGSYKFTGLPSGTFYICSKDNSYQKNFLDKCYDNQPALVNATAIAATQGLTTPNINIGLALGGVITGRVTDALTGAAVNDVYVYAYTSTTESIQPVATDSIYSFRNGYYELTGLPTGTYYIKFGPGSSVAPYISTYYDGKTAALATPVDVTQGNTTSNINAALNHGGVLKGQVTSRATGMGLKDVVVQLKPVGSTDYPNTKSSDAAGYYTFTQLLPDNYTLKFESPYNSPYLDGFYNNKETEAAADPINVTLNTTQTIDLPMDTGGQIRGRFLDAVTGESLRLAAVSISVYTSTTGAAISYNDYIFRIDTTGQYTISGLRSGTYFVNIAPYSSLYLPKFYDYQNTQATATPISVTANNLTDNINFRLDKGGQIAGKVTDAQTGAALTSVGIRAYTATVQSNNSIGSSVDANGLYTLTNLLPGTYYLEFDEYANNYLDEFYDNKQTLPAATPITVTLNNVVSNINAALDKPGTITGRVTAADTGGPLKDVLVNAYAPSQATGVDYCGNPTYTTVQGYAYTDASGVYTITTLRPAAYRISFDADTFRADAITRSYLSRDYTNIVTVTANSTLSNIDAALTHGAQILGRLTKEDTGMGIQGGSVYFYRRETYSNGGFYFSYVRAAYPDANGYYTSTGLTADTYYLRLSAFQGQTSDAQGYRSEWYDNQLNSASATGVVLTQGQIKTGVNAALARGGGITGRVTDAANGQGIRGVFIEIVPRISDQDGSTYASSDAQGYYTATGLATGTYTVTFATGSSSSNPTYAYQFYSGQSLYGAAQVVNVTQGANTPNINAALQSGGRINGRVFAQDTRLPFENQTIFVAAYNTENKYFRYTYAVANSGIYSLTGLPSGTYKVLFTGTYVRQGCTYQRYLDTWYNQRATREVADPITVSAPEGVNNINGALPITGTSHQPLNKLGVIAGTVVNTASQPLINIAATALKLGTDNFWHGAGFATTNAQGKYEIAGLADGNYRVYFNDPLRKYQDIYFNNATSIAAALDVAVTISATSNANAQLASAATPLVMASANSGSTYADPRTGQVTIALPFSKRSDLTITRVVTCTDGSEPSAVFLQLIKSSGTTEYTMTRIITHTYQATIPKEAMTSNASISVRSVCGLIILVAPVATIVLYDPSGLITDASSGLPIKDATVTLYNVPGWTARTGPSDTGANTCESNASKASGATWGQPAPTDLGQRVVAELSSGIISPTINPQTTSAIGYYGWDVAAGCWYVVVQAAGYQTQISSLVGVPPAVTDLNIALKREGATTKKVYLPLVRRQ